MKLNAHKTFYPLVEGLASPISNHLLNYHEKLLELNIVNSLVPFEVWPSSKTFGAFMVALTLFQTLIEHDIEPIWL